MKQIELDISAIRQSDSQNNAYVLLLNEINGNRQLPIVIGGASKSNRYWFKEKEKVILLMIYLKLLEINLKLILKK